MPTVKIAKGQEARALMLEGIKDIAGPVGSTLGPYGKTVVVNNFQNGLYYPHVTKDGVTVARNISPNNGDNANVRVAASNLVKQASIETARKAGDGTTSSVVLAEALCKRGVELVALGANPHEIKKGMEVGLNEATKFLLDLSIPVPHNSGLIKSVASVSANGDQAVADMVTKAYSQVSENGIVVLENSKTNKTYVETVMGMQVAGGCSPFFFNDTQRLRCVLENPVFAITTEAISKFSDIEHVGNAAAKMGRPLVIIAESVTGEVLAFLAANIQKLPSCVINLADFGDRKGDVLRDIEAVTGAKLCGKEAGRPLSKATESFLGSASKVEVYSEKTIIIDGDGEFSNVQERTSLISASIDCEEDDERREWLQKRLAAINGGISCIYVGANTDGEAKELYDRYDDAVRAVRCAISSGVLPGGGVAYVRASEYRKNPAMTNDIKLGYNAFYESLTAPLRKICENKSPEPKKLWLDRFFGAKGRGQELFEEVIECIEGRNMFFGYDARNGIYGDMADLGIVDPTMVCTTALKNAVSVAGGIITTDFVVVNVN